MNVVFIMTDTQNKSMVGAYGNPAVDTPNLDRLCRQGLRFENAYTTCPVCTPARGAIFSGLYPQNNGAIANNMSTYAHVPLMGEIFRQNGFRAAYTGKWHLDGSAYYGDGVAGGGFEDEYWYDGKRWFEDIGEEGFRNYMTAKSPDDLRRGGLSEETIWGYRVASRAISFLETVGDEKFVLAVSFDEPHGPSPCPPAYWERFSGEELQRPPNFNAPVDGKPRLQHLLRQEPEEQCWEAFAAGNYARRFYGCNAFIDRQIGRVLDAVERLHGDDTLIVYTSDHGDMSWSHGLRDKGPYPYQEITNMPFIIRRPGGHENAVTHSLASHVDILPTMLDYAGLAIPGCLPGVSLRPLLDGDPQTSVRDMAMMVWHRFGKGGTKGGWYPIRSAVTRTHKLNINLLDTDELYDLQADPYELENRIDDPACADVRADLHDRLLKEMWRTQDLYASHAWGDRPWRSVMDLGRHDIELPVQEQTRFAFQPSSVDHMSYVPSGHGRCWL